MNLRDLTTDELVRMGRETVVTLRSEGTPDAEIRGVIVTQGSDQMHEHMHQHQSDANHGHHANAKQASAVPAAELAMMLAAQPGDALGDASVASHFLGQPAADAMTAAAAAGTSLVAAAMEALGSPWGVEQRGEAWVLLGRDGEAGTFDRYELAVGEIGGLAFTDGARPVLEQTWRSEMCFEDEETPDGRYIAPGGLRYRDMPLPLMLQTVTDIGHFGAVLCGAILSAKTTDGTAIAAGEFDDNDAGTTAAQIVEARGRFGVSIDGMQPAEAEYECTKRDDATGECMHERVRFNVLTIGGLTITPFPAFPSAYIALEQRAATASGEGEHHGAEGDERGQNDTPCEDCPEPPAAAADPRARAAQAFPAGKAGAAAVGKEEPFTASGGVDLSRPPADWFADPRFSPGDGRMILQPTGKWACPLTVTADGRVFGHIASWFTCHTGYADRCVTPPRSGTGYAAFMLRPLMTADGTVVKVGHLSMGCGHASTAASLSVEQVRAHYDGGPGAVRVAQVACGEDAHGIWFSGALDPAASPEQVREFQACSVSGDWREVWGRRKGLDLVACLAGVTVPGFPIAAAALAAAGFGDGLSAELDRLRLEVAARMEDGRTVALVAAGAVPQVSAEGRMLAVLTGRLDDVERRLAQAELVTGELRAAAAESIFAGIPERAAAGNGTR